MKPKRIETYREFWPFYLQEHSCKATKQLHILGTLLGLACAIYLGATDRWAWLPLSLVFGYGFAWYSHFFIQKNRPATFRYPLWSFISDFRMMWHYLTGRLR